jgi:hypothetical protein
MTTPLATGTKITLHIGAGTSIFRASGRVIHSRANRGFGVEFESDQMDPSSLALLQAWLSEAHDLYTSEGVG